MTQTKRTDKTRVVTLEQNIGQQILQTYVVHCINKMNNIFFKKLFIRGGFFNTKIDLCHH